MRWSYNLDRSRAVAIWLFAVALCVVAILVVGGMTRLTGSGLSITDWRPVDGVVPPLSQRGWDLAFARYQRIPQYQLINRGMSLAAFKPLYWWEWTHRLLARLIGVVFFVPFVVLLILRRIPQRLLWRCVVIFLLGALQGLVGWWMVASGLEARTSVAPERLATHLGLALLLICACIWTGFEAAFGRRRNAAAPATPWSWAAPALAGLVYLQCLMGALVSGSHAGLVDQDWPLMNGRVVPIDYVAPGQGFAGSLLHSAPAVQFDHRLVAYILLAASAVFVISTYRFSHAPREMRRWGHILAGAVGLQMSLGIATLWLGDPLWLAAAHQLGAVAVLTLGLTLAWRSRRT